MIGKKLKVNLELKKVTDIPEKLSHSSICKYQWMDEERTQYETKIVDERTRNPAFNYKAEHTLDIDDDLITYMMENTLTIGVYGKAEQKKKKVVVAGASESNGFSSLGGERMRIIQEEDEDESNKTKGTSPDNKSKSKGSPVKETEL